MRYARSPGATTNGSSRFLTARGARVQAVTSRLFLFILLSCAACHRKRGDAYKIEQVTAQGSRACATMKDGTVKCWGRKGTESVLVPTLAPGMTNVSKVCVADD